nr:RecName: Full=Aurein-2.5 [Ranoidea raniformis]6GS9_A Chain A, Aurein 2.5 [Ranoidea aurea]
GLFDIVKKVVGAFGSL